MRNSAMIGRRFVVGHSLVALMSLALALMAVPTFALAATPEVSSGSSSDGAKVYGWGFCWPQAMAIVGDNVWVANRFGDSVTEFNAITVL